MAHVITQGCCNDATCVLECPVDCIRPTPDDPQFLSAEMLYIDPASCIDCGACVPACPVGAIYPDSALPETFAGFPELNARYFERNPLVVSDGGSTTVQRPRSDCPSLRVAVVGGGVAGAYAAADLLERGRVEVDVFDRLPAPWGLLRYGVAPDHLATKGMTAVFDAAFRTDAFEYHLNVEIGHDITIDELLQYHHAVILAAGASRPRRLSIPGEDLAGSHSAGDFVAWYSGHPDFAHCSFDLSTERAVVIGTGNVALDVARVLSLDPDQLLGTDVAPHALEVLRCSNIREVVVIGRRGPADASYTAAEFLALGTLPGVDIVIDAPADALREGAGEPAGGLAGFNDEARLTIAREFARRPRSDAKRRIVFKYLSAPIAIDGHTAVEGVVLDGQSPVPTSLVFAAVGFRGTPLPGVPFDADRGVIPTDHSRVLRGDRAPIPGVYATGWIKRGAQGGLGRNRNDAQETADAIVHDFNAGRLRAPAGGRAELLTLLAGRHPHRLGRGGWQAIDAHERRTGTALGRPRFKLTTRADLLAVARAAGP
jgi:ferredoxin--NADP+ reductase